MAFVKWGNKKLVAALKKELNFKPMCMRPGPAVYHELSVYKIKGPIGLAEISTRGEGEDGVVRHTGSVDFIFSWDRSSGRLAWVHRPRGGISSCCLEGEKVAVKTSVGKPYHLCLTTGERIDV